MQVMLELELTFGEVQADPPTVTVAPATKPLPEMVRVPPPDWGPLFGETLKRSKSLNANEFARVPDCVSALVTVTE